MPVRRGWASAQWHDPYENSLAPCSKSTAPIDALAEYVALPDPLFPGAWRAEPVNYDGRGAVYLFHSEQEARSYVKERNGFARKAD